MRQNRRESVFFFLNLSYYLTLVLRDAVIDDYSVMLSHCCGSMCFQFTAITVYSLILRSNP